MLLQTWLCGWIGIPSRDKTLHRLFGQLNSRHDQLSGTFRAHTQVIDEAFNTGLVGGCRDNISTTEQKSVEAYQQSLPSKYKGLSWVRVKVRSVSFLCIYLFSDCDVPTCNEHLLLPGDSCAKASHSTKDLPQKDKYFSLLQ